MRAYIVVMALAMLLAWWEPPPSAVAQSSLERLEQQIRQRVEGAERLEPVPELNNRPAAPSPPPQTQPRGGNVAPGYLARYSAIAKTAAAACGFWKSSPAVPPKKPDFDART